MKVKGALGRLVVMIVAAGLVGAAIAFPLVGGAGVVAGQVADSAVGSTSDLESGVMPAATTVTDSAGTPIAYLFDQYRIPVPADRISPAMKAAIVAIEDRRFFEHGGFDPLGAARALVNNSNGGATQGASTLTEQYVKNYDLYVAARTEAERRAAVAPSYARKLKEAELAISLDHRVSKDDILADYLNIVYFGNGAYGVGAAAQAYFGTTADRLTVAQAALLAGMVQSPTEYDPIQHPEAATGRRNVVIEQLRQQGSVDAGQAAAAAAEPLGVAAVPTAPAEGCIGAGDAGFFCSYVVSYLAQSGITQDQLESGGFTIRTTLDRGALDKLKAAVDGQVPPTQPHVADVISVITPGADGHHVLAMAANRTYGNKPGQSSYGLPYVPENMGAGSVYKIFTAATALEQGALGINTVIPVPPSGYTSPIYRGPSGTPIPVRNDGNYADQLPLTDALAESPNTAFVKLEETTGVPPVVDMAERLGLTSLATTPASRAPGAPSIGDVARRQRQASFTLGVSPTSSLELANVMATLASHGTWCPPSPVLSVTDRSGVPVTVTQPACKQVLDPGIADTLMNGLSRDDAPGGTSAAAAGSEGWDRPVAAKTGTTQEYKSAAFVGATPQLAGAAIVFDDSNAPRPICDGTPPFSCGSGNIYGGKVPARTWYRGVGDILAGQPVVPLPPPDPRYLGQQP
ncbi:Peptidoglycan glycosyltransferase [Pseudonocardia dioxanivorans CB1190]|uniref:Peptidoglycan glycosyltransferase n=1 Tax=Pseudonocardia dioxanivorans (strain ATCC 55486 / DSM 44775 / JCM 13855 / CB1190) TaxID=675635 RepID=F4D0V6_PSEUX|nr:transglycosylase domain-containing protein [Pseudonocardia dioxanivorans]AEA25808.1 Peptidoglycan glycosyltransferase [Pseudonocardia dioxanivorans CB1190]